MVKLRTQCEGREEKGPEQLRKLILQKLESEDDIEHFLTTFEWSATQQEWPGEVWDTQLPSLLTGKVQLLMLG